MSKKSKSTTQNTKTTGKVTTVREPVRKTMPTGVTINRNAVPGTTTGGTSPQDFLKAIESRGKTTATQRTTGSDPTPFLAAIARRDKIAKTAPRTGTVKVQDFLTAIENGTIIKKRPTKQRIVSQKKLNDSAANFSEKCRMANTVCHRSSVFLCRDTTIMFALPDNLL